MTIAVDLGRKATKQTNKKFPAKFIEPIAFKQVMFGSFNSTTVAKWTFYDNFRIEMVI